METKFTKLKNWITGSFQLITVGLLVFAIVLILKQQNDISVLKSRINDVDNNVDNVNSKLDDVESNLSSEIDDVKSTVRIWSN